MNIQQYIPRAIVTRARGAMRRLKQTRGMATGEVEALEPPALNSVFVGSGEMFDRINGFDWSSTVLGSRNDWPAELRTSVSIILSSSVPMCLIWGSTHILFYNDSCVPLLADKHPDALGLPLSNEFLEALPLIGESWRGAVNERTFVEDKCVLTERAGRLEEMFVSYTLNPIPSPDDCIAGMLLSAADTTTRVVGDRRARTLLEVSASGLGANRPQDALLRSAEAMARNPYDVPFALLYWLDETGKCAELIAHTGLEPGTAASPTHLNVLDAEQPWPFASILKSRQGVLLSDVQSRFPGLNAGAYQASITRARIEPLAIIGSAEGAFTPRALMITGLSPRPAVIDDCPTFHELLGATVGNVASAALAHEVQRLRVEAEGADKLRDSEEKLRQLSAALQEVSSIVDAGTGAVLYVSPAYERIWGRSCESLYAAPSSWLEAVAEEDRKRMEQVFARTCESGARCEEEFRIRLPDGKLRWIRWRAYPVYNTSGRVVRVASAAEDITDRKANESARESLEWQLRQSQKLEALGTLTGGIAHDFNNLLTAILGNCDLIRYELDVDQQPSISESLSEICAAGARGKDLVQRLLSFGRPKQQQPRSVDLEPILTDVVKLLRATLPAGAKLELQVDAAMPKVRADETLLHQVVLNLATNAWQALGGRPGFVQIRVEAPQVDAAMADEHPVLVPGQHIHLSVRDNGCGIDAEHLERIFEPFFTTKAPNAGTGLGLSVVHGIVHSLGGCIFVESERGTGSTFHVYLPASVDTEDSLSPPRQQKPESGGQGEEILFVDDEPSLVKVAVAQLKRRGYRVHACTQPLAALEAFRAQPTRFAIVITDYNMPQMSGIDFGEQVLRIRPDAVIVLVSGHMRSNELDRAHACGILQVVSKPFVFDELNAIVRRLLAGREVASA